MKKCKVLFVGITGNVGGVENFICNIAENLDKSLFDIAFLVHQEPHQNVKNRIKKIGDILYVNGVKKNPFIFIYQIFKIFHDNSFDVVHLNECSAVYCIYILPILIKKRNTKVIIHSHNGSSRGLRKVFHMVLRGLQNSKADCRWACSNIAGKWMYGERSFQIIKNGISVNKYLYSNIGRDRIRKELGITDDCIVIGSIGRLEAQKNYTRLISIFNEFKKLNKNSVLVIVGDGSQKSSLVEQVNNNNLEHCVIFLGLRNDIPDILSCYDLFLMPSLYEGLPFVGIEAQANGLPILYSSTVSEELKITNKAHSFKLELEDTEIAKIVYSIISGNSRETVDIKNIKNAGFDILESIKMIQEEYLSMGGTGNDTNI